jgi:pSer/pThr/pTyr-binding forkhead associated (FHA) protein
VAAQAGQALPAVRWDAVVTVDPALYGTPNPTAPVNVPVRTFTLFEIENMIGRGGKEIRVQIPIPNDDGVSRRQALLVRRPDNTLILRDLGSANGTQLNGVELAAGVDTPVKDGDVIAIGAWTKITVRAVPAIPDAAS